LIAISPEVIGLCRFGAQETYLINVENICTNIFRKQFDTFKKKNRF